MNDAAQIRDRIQSFLRLFGLNDQHTTPCGQPLSVPHAHALMRLLEAEQGGARGVRILDLGQHLQIDKSNISRLCARMEEEGHVERRPCPDDGRAKRLWLTEEGRRVARDVDHSSLERFQRLCDAINDGERRQLLNSLETLNEALRELFPQQDSG